MDDVLDGKAAVVTGSTNGIGRAIASSFAEHGADLVIADIDEDPTFEEVPTAEYINRNTNSSAKFVNCDVKDYGDIENAVAAAEEFGGLDVMVNNVGQSERARYDHDFLEFPEDAYHDIIDLNLASVVFGSQIAIKKLIERGGGSIINMSSVVALQGDPVTPLYTAAKGGVRTLTYSLASRFGRDGIRVNAIHPGIIRTNATTGDDGTLLEDMEEKYVPKTALGHPGEPIEVAEAAVFLASDYSSHITAESLSVDGGIANTL